METSTKIGLLCLLVASGGASMQMALSAPRRKSGVKAVALTTDEKAPTIGGQRRLVSAKDKWLARPQTDLFLRRGLSSNDAHLAAQSRDPMTNSRAPKRELHRCSLAQWRAFAAQLEPEK